MLSRIVYQLFRVDGEKPFELCDSLRVFVLNRHLQFEFVSIRKPWVYHKVCIVFIHVFEYMLCTFQPHLHFTNLLPQMPNKFR